MSTTATPKTVRTAQSARAARSGPNNRRWALIFASAAILVFVFYQYLLPHLDQSVKSFFDSWLPISTMEESLVWIICAIGLNIVVGYAGLLDLGYVAFWAIGGYTAGWLMSSFFSNQNFSFFGVIPPEGTGIHINFWLVLVIAAAFCALWGVIIGAPTLRLKGDYLAIVTLGFGEIIPQVFYNGDCIGPACWNVSNGTQGIYPVDSMNAPKILPGMKGATLGIFDQPLKYIFFCLVAAFCVFVSLRIREGRLGRAWLAIREDELAASMMGVPLMRTKLAAYAVGAAMGGFGGVIFAQYVGGVVPDRFNFSISITLLAMVVLGGMGNVWGVMVGALLLAWINATGLKQVGVTFNQLFHTDINFPANNYLLFGGILVLMMLFRRAGLFPEMRTKAVLEEDEVTDDMGGTHLSDPEEVTA